MKKESLLYKYIALSPPVIILFYLYTKNGAYINYWHTVAAALVFALLSLAFYAVAARIGKPSGGRAALLVAAFWALSVMGRIVYRNIRRIMPFSETLIVRFALGIVVLLIVLAVFIMIFIYGKRVQRKETFLLIAVFETVLLTLNIVPATASFIARENANRLSVSAVVPDEDFAVNPDAPSPNIYWLFMDGMLGFKG
ncbi:MAG: hypothetical protein LBD07_04135, partial [Spirochaetaceae bacterium]|nr:hypothetical protein [Spirochaetaceae bacterium]